MVRAIDGEQRRRELAEAVWRVIRRDGLAAASVRGVAAEAGLSTGSVRHFFDTQAGLHAFAMSELTGSVADRIQAASHVEDPQERAVAMLSELLPVTEQTHGEFFAWLQFASRAALDPQLAPIAKDGFDRMRELFVAIVDERCRLGLVPADTDVRAAAVELGVLVDGLTLQLLLAPHLMTRKKAVALLRSHLAAPATTGRSTR